jgi:hypothetical protein
MARRDESLDKGKKVIALSPLLGKMVFGSILPRPAGLLVSSHARLRIYEGSFAMVI